MRIPHAIAKAALAAALTAGLAVGAPAAQAGPPVAPAVSATHSHDVGPAAVAKKKAKAKTKVSAKAPSEIKAGDDLTITAKLTRKSGKKYKAYAKKKLQLVLLDEPGADSGTAILTQKTNKKGVTTFVLQTEADDSGDASTYEFLVAYAGGSKDKASESASFTVTIK